MMEFVSWDDDIPNMMGKSKKIHGSKPAGSNTWRYVSTVPYVWPYFVGIFTYIGLQLGLIYGRYLHFRILKFPLTNRDGYDYNHQAMHE